MVQAGWERRQHIAADEPMAHMAHGAAVLAVCWLTELQARWDGARCARRGGRLAETRVRCHLGLAPRSRECSTQRDEPAWPEPGPGLSTAAGQTAPDALSRGGCREGVGGARPPPAPLLGAPLHGDRC